MLLKLGLVPPEVVFFDGVVVFCLPVHIYRWCQLHFGTAAPHKAIAGHHPADENPMFFKCLYAVLGTGGVHGALPGLDRRKRTQRAPVEFHQGEHRIEAAALLFFLGRSMGTPKEDHEKRQPNERQPVHFSSFLSLSDLIAMNTRK